MEPFFGHDFSRVRIHSDPPAEVSADAVEARAYTVGQNIVFGAGQYAPGTARGRRLLAHELAHTLQQDPSPHSAGGNLLVGSAGDQREKDAEAAAQSVVSGSPVSFYPTPGRPIVLRQQAEQQAQAEVVDYDAFSNPDGTIKSGEDALQVVHSWEQLERIYADADKGNARAQGFTRDLEETYAAAGGQFADQMFSARCSVPVVRELSTECLPPTWTEFKFLRADKPSGLRLRRVIGDAYAQRSKQNGLRNQLIIRSLQLLYAGSVFEKAILAESESTITATRPPGVSITAATALPGESTATATALPGESTATATALPGESTATATAPPGASTTTASMPAGSRLGMEPGEGRGPVTRPIPTSGGEKAAPPTPPGAAVLEEEPVFVPKRLTDPVGEKINLKPSRMDTVYHRPGPKDPPPEVACKSGLPARGTNTNLWDHATGHPDTAFRGTTLLPGRAVEWSETGTPIVYKIRSVDAYDVNAATARVDKGLSGFSGNPMRGENEFAIRAAVPASHIEGYFPVVDGKLGDFVPNPNFKPPMPK
jgi:hypothetical protein